MAPPSGVVDSEEVRRAPVRVHSDPALHLHPSSIALLLAMAVLFLPATGMGFSHEALFTLTGEASGDAFGSAVAPAGDFNGDGYPDFIVGAQDNGAGGTGAGWAYAFYGGPDADNVPDVVLTGAASDAFGLSVAGIGDVNEDGSDDVIVGAPFSDVAGDFAGRAYVYFGGAPADDVADLILSGEAVGDNLGMSVSGDGDVIGTAIPTSPWGRGTSMPACSRTTTDGYTSTSVARI